MDLPASWGVQSHVATQNTTYLPGARPIVRVTVQGVPDRSDPVGHEVRASLAEMGLLPGQTTSLDYQVYVPEGADYGSHGGKLPGLAGAPGAGSVPTGGSSLDGTAWSARLMFHPDGGIIGYLYVLAANGNAKGTYGIGLHPRGTTMILNKGAWNTISITCRMNTQGRADGWFTCSLNGVEGIKYGTVRYHSTPGLTATHLLHQLRYGGNGDDVGPASPQTWDFQDHHIATRP